MPPVDPGHTHEVLLVGVLAVRAAQDHLTLWPALSAPAPPVHGVVCTHHACVLQCAAARFVLLHCVL
jgi:hypothetical protein